MQEAEPRHATPEAIEQKQQAPTINIKKAASSTLKAQVRDIEANSTSADVARTLVTNATLMARAADTRLR